MGRKGWISLGIVLVLCLHALPVLSYQGVRQTRWPFLVWAMYARSYPPGPIDIVIRTLIAVSPDGSTREIEADDVGLSGPAFRNNYVAPFTRGDTTAARWLMDRLNRRGKPGSVAEIQVQTVQFTLVDPGVRVDTLPVVRFPPAPATR